MGLDDWKPRQQIPTKRRSKVSKPKEGTKIMAGKVIAEMRIEQIANGYLVYVRAGERVDLREVTAHGPPTYIADVADAAGVMCAAIAKATLGVSESGDDGLSILHFGDEI